MRRIALGLLLVQAAAPTAGAEAAERTDRIPASVGPADVRSYYVNPSANLPEGLTAERWTEVARRVLERWGGTYLGPTAASPDALEDGLNVIGFSTQLTGWAVGQNAKVKSGLASGGGDTCEPAPGHQPTESLTTAATRVKLRLRSDVVRRGKVRRRTKTVTRTNTRPAVATKPLDARRCKRSDGMESDPATVKHESDIQMRHNETWFTGPGLPTSSDLDLETVLLHELGHSVGLAHQPQDCDPSSMMRPVTGRGEYWRGLDEVFFDEPCAAPFPVTPDPPAATEGPFPGATLGGRTFHVNPAAPAGYDSGRFVALVRSTVERWGGTFAGTSAAAPTIGDGLNVIGFDLIGGSDYELTNATTQEFFLLPVHQVCPTRSGRPSVYKVKRVTKRVRAGGRTLKLRKDRAVKAPGPAVPVPTGSCTTVPPRMEEKGSTSEIDLGIAHEMVAYEMGPAHPVQRTKVDMATMLAKALGEAAGAQQTDPCDRTSPVAHLEPGDWWRSAADVRRVNCHGPEPAGRAADDRTGRIRTVLIQD